MSFPQPNEVAVHNQEKNREKSWEFDEVFDVTSTQDSVYRGDVLTLLTHAHMSYNKVEHLEFFERFLLDTFHYVKCYNPLPYSYKKRHPLNSNVLYCTVLYCTVLYCTVLYCTVLY